MGRNAYAKMTQTSWENTALKHMARYQLAVREFGNCKITYPKLNLNHLKRLTTEIGMVQFCTISKPDLSSGYTLDDNARALIVIIKDFELTGDKNDLKYINLYLKFIKRCQLQSGRFINYISQFNEVELRNETENLEDANGRALWALGTLMSIRNTALPNEVFEEAQQIFDLGLKTLTSYKSPRALAFAIKGLYFAYSVDPIATYKDLILVLTDRLVEHYQDNSSSNWHWFEHQLTYANSILPEAMLFGYLVSAKEPHLEIAMESMDFLISKMFPNGTFKIISNKGWHQKDSIPYQFGEQPIEACYMVQALDLFYNFTNNVSYKEKLKLAFDWYLGRNHLNHIMHNPATGGCYDGLEKENVNLNQGAESTVCYLMSRLLIEKYVSHDSVFKLPLTNKKLSSKEISNYK